MIDNLNYVIFFILMEGQFEPQNQQQYIPIPQLQFEPQFQQFEPQVQQYEPQIQKFEPQNPQTPEPQAQQFEFQNQQVLDIQSSQQYEPQVQQIEHQIQPMTTQQTEQFEPKVVPFEPQVQPFEPQIQTFESQVQPVKEGENQNKPIIETSKEFKPEPEIDNMIVPMIEQDKQSNYSNNNTDDIIFLDRKKYALHKVFIFFIVESVIYTIMNFFIFLPDIIINSIIIVFLGVFVLLSIRCYDEKLDNNACSVFVIIIFIIYKIFFHEFIYCLIYKVLRMYFVPLFIGVLHSTLFVYYLFLIIFTCCYKLQLLVYFIVGLVLTLIMFGGLCSIAVDYAGIYAGFVFVEICILLLALKIAIYKKKLDEKRFVDNMIIIDFYKYVVPMILSYVVMIIAIYAIYCVCLILKACCCKSKPTSVDEDNNVYDQFKNKIGHFSKKPKYTDSEGNLYDKHHNKIEPDCNIF